MAAINKRGPYQWRAQIRRHGFPPLSKTFTTKAEAEAWAKMSESEMARGVWVSRGEAEATTLYEALERYGPRQINRQSSPLKTGSANAQMLRG